MKEKHKEEQPTTSQTKGQADTFEPGVWFAETKKAMERDEELRRNRGGGGNNSM